MGNRSDTADMERRCKARRGKFKPRRTLVGERRDGMYTVGGILSVGMLNEPDNIRGPYKPAMKGYWDRHIILERKQPFIWSN
jgi:hypothetical protein